MLVSNERPVSIADEIKIVPRWAAVLAAIAFVGVQIVFNIFAARDHNPPPPPVRVLLGLLVGTVAATYILLIGYVNRDAGRRGMSRVLWTIVAAVIANGLGIILYFILRQPLQTGCPKCGNGVQSGFNFCPKCSCQLSPSCPQCKNIVRPGDVYCPYCGCTVASTPKL